MAKVAEKQPIVEEISALVNGAATAVVVDYRGLTVAQDTEMRTELRNAGVKYQVVKNTTLRLVFKELGIEGLDDTFVGPTTVAYSNDIVAPAKIVCKFADQIEVMEVKSGIIDGKAASKDEVVALSKVPDVTTLYSQVVYGMLFPMTKLAMLVKAVAEKAESEGGAAPAAVEETAAVEEAAPAAEEAPAEAPAEA
mgnify:CR=1 FL=1